VSLSLFLSIEIEIANVGFLTSKARTTPSNQATNFLHKSLMNT